MAKVTKAAQRAVNKYMKENYDRINLTVSKGEKDKIKAHAERCGESVNGFIARAIDETMARDSMRVDVATLYPQTTSTGTEADRYLRKIIENWINEKSRE